MFGTWGFRHLILNILFCRIECISDENISSITSQQTWEAVPQVKAPPPLVTTHHGPTEGKICHQDNCRTGSDWSACECQHWECCSAGSTVAKCQTCNYEAVLQCSHSSMCQELINGEVPCCLETYVRNQEKKVCARCNMGRCSSDGDCSRAGLCCRDRRCVNCPTPPPTPPPTTPPTQPPPPVCTHSSQCPLPRTQCCLKRYSTVKRCGHCYGICEGDGDCQEGKCCNSESCGECGVGGPKCLSVATCRQGQCCLYLDFEKIVGPFPQNSYVFRDKTVCVACNTPGNCLANTDCAEGLHCSRRKKCEPIGPRPCSTREDCNEKCLSVATCLPGYCCLYLDFEKIRGPFPQSSYVFRDKTVCAPCNTPGNCLENTDCAEGLHCSRSKKCEPIAPRPCSTREDCIPGDCCLIGSFLSSPVMNRLIDVVPVDWPTGPGRCGRCSGTCTTDTSCPTGQCCSNRRCGPCIPSCIDQRYCRPEQCCLRGTIASPSRKICVDDCDGICTTNRDCPSQVCLPSGRCKPGPKEPGTCWKARDCDEWWKNGKDQCCLKGIAGNWRHKCADCSGPGTCRTDEDCRNGLTCDQFSRKCICNRNEDCTHGQVCDRSRNCVTNACLEASQCQSPDECCLKSPSSFSPMKTCGNCEPPRICDNNRDCRNGLKCLNGKCITGKFCFGGYLNLDSSNILCISSITYVEPPPEQPCVMITQCQTYECCLKSPNSWRKTCGMCEPPRICDYDRDCRTGLKCTNGNCLPVITPKTTPPTQPPVKKCSRFQDCRRNECCLIGGENQNFCTTVNIPMISYNFIYFSI